MGDAFFPPAGVAALWRAAKAKGLCDGYAGFVDCLRRLSTDLFDGGETWECAAPPAEDAPPPGWREIGDRFWREGGGREERRLAGSFYTPEQVIDAILDGVWQDIRPGAAAPEQERPVCDPAMGCGYFHLRLVDRLREDGVPLARLREWAGRNLYGVDKEAGAVFLARALLWLSLSEPGSWFLPDPAKLRLGDSLLGPGFGEAGDGVGLDWTRTFPEVAREGGFGVVLGNPPYEVLTNFSKYPASKILAKSLRECGWYRDSLTGQINLYRCFIERGLGLVRPGGALSYVVPLSLARDAGAAAVRRRLIMRENAAEWRFYDEAEALFHGVTQSACVFLARREGGAAGRVRVVSPRGAAEYAAADVACFGGGTMALPEAGERDVALWRWLRENIAGRLDEWAEMRVGEVDQTVYRDCMREDDTGCVLARGAHLQAFRLDVRPLPGPERFLDRELFLAKKGRSAERCLARVDQWRVAQMGIRNMRTLPRLVAALAPPGVFLGNSLNVYWPKAGVTPAFLCGLLNSRLLDWVFRLTSGNNNINLREMAGLPAPPLTGAAQEEVAKAFQRCVEAVERGEDAGAERQALDRAVEAGYGAPEELLSGVFPIL